MHSNISKSKTTRDIFLLITATLLVTLLVWLPHILKLNSLFSLDFSAGFNTIFRNYDGIEYVIIAKAFYFPDQIAQLPQSLPANYFAAHFPGYSLLILAFSPLLGFLKSMVFVSMLFTIASAIAFYFLVKDFKLTSQPLFLSLLFLVLPARWLIIHSVGSSEPIFIFFTILTFYFFLKFEQTNEPSLRSKELRFGFLSKDNRYSEIILAGIFGALAQFTRPPGILIFGALGIYILLFRTKLPLYLLSFWGRAKRGLQNLDSGQARMTFFKAATNYFPLLLIPLTLTLIFAWYQIAYNDFWAYFHSGDNIHLSLPPYQIFNKAQYWVGDIWLEDIVYIYILGFLAGIMLLKRGLQPLGVFVLTFMVAAVLIAHRDISRYIAPIFPFALIAYEKVLISKEFKIVLAIVILGIYLYSQNYILNNTAPYPNLEFFD